MFIVIDVTILYIYCLYSVISQADFESLRYLLLVNFLFFFFLKPVFIGKRKSLIVKENHSVELM